MTAPMSVDLAVDSKNGMTLHYLGGLAVREAVELAYRFEDLRYRARIIPNTKNEPDASAVAEGWLLLATLRGMVER